LADGGGDDGPTGRFDHRPQPPPPPPHDGAAGRPAELDWDGPAANVDSILLVSVLPQLGQTGGAASALMLRSRAKRWSQWVHRYS
jgi:hypothetical protein